MHGPYRELEGRWQAACASRALPLREITYEEGRTLLCVDMGDRRRPAVTISAGVHGDEPAGPWALLELVETGALDPRFNYRIWPCTNPTGFDTGRRVSVDGLDINRTFAGDGGSPEARVVLAENRWRRFALSLDLHEDCDATGFYCYEYGGGTIGRAVLAALDERDLSIDPLDATFALAGPLDDAHCRRERGRVSADSVAEAALLGGLSYSLALARRQAHSALTFETPSAAPWERRLAMHRTAVLAAIAALVEESPCIPFK